MEEVLIFITPRILPPLSMAETKNGATGTAGTTP